MKAAKFLPKPSLLQVQHPQVLFLLLLFRYFSMRKIYPKTIDGLHDELGVHKCFPFFFHHTSVKLSE